MHALATHWTSRKVLAVLIALLLAAAVMQVGLMLWSQEAKAAPSELATWYLAEGSNQWGFGTAIYLQNPNDVPVTAEVTYMTTAGVVTRPDITIPQTSLTVLNTPGDVPGRDFSTKVVCAEGLPIAVSRVMAWAKPNLPAAEEGHSSIGVNEPSTTWLLPEGSSQWGFETWLLIQNPQGAAAPCTVTYMLDSGTPVVRNHTVPAHSRMSFGMASEIGQDDASIEVSSPVPVIAERAMYRYNRMMGHESIGTAEPNVDFYLAEGSDAWGFTTYVLVQNPMADNNTVTVTFMNNSGVQTTVSQFMAPNSRWTIDTSKIVQGQDFSTHVRGTLPIAAERAMYWSTTAKGDGSTHDTIGLSSAHMTFYMPDGGVSVEDDGLNTWTLVQNPGATAADIRVTYMDTSGNVTHFLDTIPATTRRTYSMADKLHTTTTLSASVKVESWPGGAPIIVESSVYSNSKFFGTNTIGGFSD